MHLVEEHYYTINKTFLKLLGIWPHDRSRLVFWQRVLVITLTVTYIILQLSVFITKNYNMVLFVKTMSFAFPSILITLKYCAFMFKSKTIKILHHYIQEDWKMIQNKSENDIMEKEAHDCQNHIIFIFKGCGCLIVALIITEFFPVILDFVLPLDEPRSRKSIITVEYFIAQDNYFYIIALHEFFIISLYAAMISSTGTQLLLFTYHSFGMFKIASHRMKHSIDDHVLHMPNCERTICEKIIHVVIAHRRAIEFSNIFTSSFNVPYCLIAILGVLSLSVNLFRFVQAITLTKNMDDIFVSFAATMGHIIYMFVANYIGQKATDYNNNIFKLVYGTSWYLMPVTSQKLILFLLTRTGKDFYYTIGFIFVAKIENFALLVNTALSYVAVMYSVQSK
ncbi:uncharacterized protein [Temnothorax nylanderi]|uniref:uncharacterized protein n=1 Tax=Temnothorax nylanderi TaxID=102681 RepID=UPI003A847E54